MSGDEAPHSRKRLRRPSMSNSNESRICVANRSSLNRLSLRQVGILCAVATGLVGVQFASFAQSSSAPVKPMKKAAPPKMKPAKMMKPSKMSKSDSKAALMVPSKIVLVFPTDASDSVSSQLSDAVTDTIQGRLSASGNYQTVFFLKSIPTIKRALNDSTITPIDASKPFAEKEDKVKTLAALTGYNLTVVSSIDSYTYDKDKNQVSFIMSGKLVDFSGEKPVVIGAVALNDESPAGGNAKEITLATELARKLAEKMMTQILSKK